MDRMPIYSIILTLGFLLMLPLFILRREKYAAGFRERLGNYPSFAHDGRKVIWLHCVSVGEANAARPLVDALIEAFPGHRLVISTTTKTGHEHSANIFRDKADAVFYFPFDFKFSVSKALDNFMPDVVLLMETEIWPRFIREAKLSGARVVIVNGRLSERSVRRYGIARSFVQRVLSDVDLALMQNEKDAERIVSLGIGPEKVRTIGNLKFDHAVEANEEALTEEFRKRFAIDGETPLIVAASTHEPEEEWILESLDGIDHFRLLIAPRHPQRFDEVAKLLEKTGRTFVRRSQPATEADRDAKIILLDTIGELRAVYPLADIVFVGGSLIPHGGQSILEPATAGKAIITGPYTHNFKLIVKEFAERDALIQLRKVPNSSEYAEQLYEEFLDLLKNSNRRHELGSRAREAMISNQGATAKTVECLLTILDVPEKLKNDN